MAQQRIGIARKFGPSFDRPDFVPSASVGYREIGKVKVDCRFKLSESQWGFLEDRSNPGGILYMDLCFDQPKDCRLSSATITVTLAAEDDNDHHTPRTIRRTDSSALQVTQYYGPRQLSGDEKKMSVKSTYSLTPNVNVLGNGGGGIGKNIEKSRTTSSRWTFTGTIHPGKDKIRGRRGARTMTYKTIKWELSENDLDPGATHSNLFHTAFAFEHEERPCYIHVQIDGKLQRTRDRVKQSLKFPPMRREEQGKTVVRIDLEPSRMHARNCLDPIAKSLARAMELANYEEIPVELPAAIQPTFQEVTTRIDSTPITQATNQGSSVSQACNSGLRPPTIQLDSSAHLMLDAPNPILQDPLFQSLAGAHASFQTIPRPASIHLTEQEILATSSSVSTTTTLIEQDAPTGNFAVTASQEPQSLLQTTPQDIGPDMEILLRLSQSPALLLFLQWLANFIDFFSTRQRPIQQLESSKQNEDLESRNLSRKNKPQKKSENLPPKKC